MGSNGDLVSPCREPGETHQRRTAEQLKAKWHELDTGHYPMLSMPEELSARLME
jgi:hypothetical protein